MPKSDTLLFLFIFLFLLSSSLVLLFPKPLPFPITASDRHHRLPTATIATTAATPTTVRHLAFGIASSARSFPNRLHYLRLWWDDNHRNRRGFVFLDSPLPPYPALNLSGLPALRLSSDASAIPYTFPRGLRSAVRIARVVKDLVVAIDEERWGDDVRWVVLGDDDTVFFPENLAAVLGKYDWTGWHYVGSGSEMVDQNEVNSFDMAFGGGGFAVSVPLARALAGVLDPCLARYAHLYGSDARVFSCVAELGVGLTKEAGFHQIDLRGDLFGMLSAHPLTPLVSLHHLDYVEPIFPGMNRVDSLRHLFEAVKIDPGRILQQTVCYDHEALRTVSLSWGYSVQVYEGNQLLPDLLSWQRTFRPWRRSRNISLGKFMYDTREFPRDPCRQPVIFFLESVHADMDHIWSNYSKPVVDTCLRRSNSMQNLKIINVFSQKFDLHIRQDRRRQCCDILPSLLPKVIDINIRKCGENELIAMHI